MATVHLPLAIVPPLVPNPWKEFVKCVAKSTIVAKFSHLEFLQDRSLTAQINPSLSINRTGIGAVYTLDLSLF